MQKAENIQNKGTGIYIYNARAELVEHRGVKEQFAQDYTSPHLSLESYWKRSLFLVH